MKKKILISLMLISLCFNLTMYSYAASLSDLQQQQKDTSEKKGELEQEKKDVANQKKTAVEKIEELNEEISISEDKLNDLNDKVKELETSINKKENELKEAEQKQADKEETLEKRLIAQYKTGKVSYWSIILNPSSFLDFFSNLHNIERIAKIDTELIETIKQEKESIEKAKEELSKQKSEVKAAKAEAEKENTILKNNKIIKNSEIAKLTEEEKELQQKIDEYQAEMNRMEAEIKKIAAANSKPSNGASFNGRLAWPCPNYSRITSYFGGRESPGGGVGSRNHKGIDLGAPHGSNILAAESGTVITVSNTCKHDYPKTVKTKCSCGGGYGNYLMVSHDGGIVTLYAHCASINVSKGQKVSRGQVIAGVGSTGYSTGNHLHFGLLQNGTYVDPLPYIK